MDLLLTPWGTVGLDSRVVVVALGLTLLTTMLFGLVPAIHATRVDVQAALAEGGTRSVAGGARGWPRRVLVVAEVALGVVLLVGAGLLIRTFVHLQTQPPGFDPRNVIMASASLEDARYEKHESVARLFDDSLARMRAIPGVESAAVSLGLPYRAHPEHGHAGRRRGRAAGRVRVLDRDLRDARVLRDAADSGCCAGDRSPSAIPLPRRWR